MASEVLKQFLVARTLHTSVVKFVTSQEGLGCESLADFAGYWTSLEDSLRQDVITHLATELGDDKVQKLQLSRLRIAWQQAAIELRSAP